LIIVAEKYVLLKMNIEILNSINGGVVLSINNYNYLYIKNKDCIGKTDDKHIFIGLVCNNMVQQFGLFCENNVHNIDNCFF